MFGKKKMQKEITYGIVGLGRFGYALATELAQAGAELVVMDRDESIVREIREYTENAFVVNNLDKKTLEETGIQNCDVAVVCIGERMDTSILTTLNLVSMGIKQVIAKASSAEHGLILEKLGAEVVYPERDMAIRLANRLENTRVLDSIQLNEKLNISKMQVPSKIVGKTVMESGLRNRFGLNIIAIEDQGEVIESVKPDYVFKERDLLILAGSKDGLQRLNQWSEE
ncbi:MAG: TrkA family potassium uptake protein [Clostridia bacterium]|nr:TrkA family potassium uptake protein [Clostridia bacterium]